MSELVAGIHRWRDSFDQEENVADCAEQVIVIAPVSKHGHVLTRLT